MLSSWTYILADDVTREDAQALQAFCITNYALAACRGLKSKKREVRTFNQHLFFAELICPSSRPCQTHKNIAQMLHRSWKHD